MKDTIPRYFLVQQIDGEDSGAPGGEYFRSEDAAIEHAHVLEKQGLKIRGLTNVQMAHGIDIVEFYRTPNVKFHPNTPPKP